MFLNAGLPNCTSELTTCTTIIPFRSTCRYLSFLARCPLISIPYSPLRVPVKKSTSLEQGTALATCRDALPSTHGVSHSWPPRPSRSNNATMAQARSIEATQTSFLATTQALPRAVFKAIRAYRAMHVTTSIREMFINMGAQTSTSRMRHVPTSADSIPVCLPFSLLNGIMF
jgi:hypothetical protein